MPFATVSSSSRGKRPWWAIAGLAAIALLAAGLYLWSLSRNGMANSYYAAAVKSATLSWKAFLFGSLDPGSFITVDKPPASIWLMALSARIFGFSSWSMLVPQAVAGVGSVLVLHHLVRRWAGDVAALLAALALALTPVAVLVFRYNNPDALLTLLLLLSTWGLWSALETGKTWKLGLAGVALGFAFLTKMLMALAGGAGLRGRLPGLRSRSHRSSRGSAGRAHRGAGGRRGLVAGCREPLARRHSSLRRRHYRQLLVRPHLRPHRRVPRRLDADQPHERRPGAARASSTRRWAARSPGCCPWPSPDSSPDSG